MPSNMYRPKAPKHKKPLILTKFEYVPYILIIALQVLGAVLIGKMTPILAGSIGFNVGVLYMTWLKRQQKMFDERMKEMERDIMRHEIEAEVRQEIKDGGQVRGW